MRVFVAYRFTGEDPAALEPVLVGVRDALTKQNIGSYCSFFDAGEFKARGYSAAKIMDYAFNQIDSSDCLFVVQSSENKSEGLLMEVGYCIAKKIPIIVAVKDTVQNTYLPEMTANVIKWGTLDDLTRGISDFNFSQLR